MSKGDLLQYKGVLHKACGGGLYEVKLTDNGEIVRGKVCGKMKQNHIRVLPGDNVEISVSPYDTSHGLITRRFK